MNRTRNAWFGIMTAVLLIEEYYIGFPTEAGTWKGWLFFASWAVLLLFFAIIRTVEKRTVAYNADRKPVGYFPKTVWILSWRLKRSYGGCFLGQLPDMEGFCLRGEGFGWGYDFWVCWLEGVSIENLRALKGATRDFPHFRGVVEKLLREVRSCHPELDSLAESDRDHFRRVIRGFLNDRLNSMGLVIVRDKLCPVACGYSGGCCCDQD